VVDGIRPRDDGVDDGVERFGPLERLQDERGHALDRDVDEDAEGAETEGDRRQELGLVLFVDAQQFAVSGDERRADDLGRDAPEARTGAVRTGRDRAGDRLPVDVAEVLHGQAVGREESGDAVQPGAREKTRPPALAVDRHEARQFRELEKRARGDRDAGEAVTGADGLDGPAARGGGVHGAPHRFDRARVFDGLRADALGARPVLPGSARACRRRHQRKLFPSPR